MKNKWTENQRWFFEHIQGMAWLSTLVREHPKMSDVIRSYSDSTDPKDARWQMVPLFSKTTDMKHKKDHKDIL